MFLQTKKAVNFAALRDAWRIRREPSKWHEKDTHF
jgi:hypothetical protein